MSDPGTPAPAPESTLIQQDGAIPETVVPAEEKPEAPVEEVKADAPAPEAPAEPVKPKRTPWYQDRINTLTRQRAEEKAERERLEKVMADLRNPERDGPGQDTPVRREQVELIARQMAESMVAKNEYEKRAKSWIEAGNKEFGAAEFMEKCNDIAALGAGDSSDFMDLITDPEAIPDGHKVVAILADNPEEAERILKLSPVKMAAALAKFSVTAKAPEKKISQAPAPIKPIGGTAKASAPSDDEPIQSWMQKRRAEVAAKAKH